jgi:hypothetical protein
MITTSGKRTTRALVLLSLLLSLSAVSVQAQNGNKPATNPRLEIYGFVQTDAGTQFNSNDRDWFDVLRPTKLPSFDNEFGEGGHTFFSVRQTRFGAKAYFPTPIGELFTQFEWELFGTGVDAGQTTLRLRHAYGEIGRFGAGQYWSPFMDIDVFPNSLEYWGPNGMAFFRNIQFRYMPVRGTSRITLALERPGASADQGEFEDRIGLNDVRGRFPLPDFSAEGRYGGDWGYVELAGIVRAMKWDDLLDDTEDLSGDAIGWGLSLSSNWKATDKATFRFQVVGGEGVQNYMNDAPADVGVVQNTDGTIEGEPLGMLGLVGFLDYQWSRLFSTSVGYSRLDIDNSNGQAANAFKSGQYALINLLYYPATNIMVGGEFQWGQRNNAFNDFSSDDFRLQFSARFNYSLKFWSEVATNDK